MKKLLDPIANAKTVAFLLIIGGVFGLLSYPPKLLSSETYTNPIPVLFGSLSSIAYIIIGFGLRKVKLWGLYSFLGLTGITILYSLFYYVSGYQMGNYVLFSSILNIVISAWFYSAKDRFNK